jgi:MoaA/NifB/PqqE/SkfB family radical SAM enzyme
LTVNCFTFVVTTLSVPVERQYLQDLVASGLNEMRISLYAFSEDTYRAIFGTNNLKIVEANLWLVSKLQAARHDEFKLTAKLPPADMYRERELPWNDAFLSEAARRLEGMGIEAAVMDTLFNFGDGRDYRSPETSSICSIVDGFRRRQLYVDWELNVVPCCYDYNSSVSFGNLEEANLEDIFGGERYKNFISAHREGRRQEYPLCSHCDRT